MGGVPFWGDQPTMRQAIRVARGHFEIFDYGDGVETAARTVGGWTLRRHDRSRCWSGRGAQPGDTLTAADWTAEAVVTEDFAIAVGRHLPGDSRRCCLSSLRGRMTYGSAH
jgi:hypothetical protein